MSCQWESQEEQRREVGCQWESQEEQRREVGCQWESQEEQRREVGCQSDSAERKEASIQVDLLTQQHSWRHCKGVCGEAWQCVSIRADEPVGGALLQHCSSHIQGGQHLHPTLPLYLLCCPLRHPQLPTIPLSRPPAPQQLQQNTSLPSLPLCDPPPLLPTADVSGPPPGLIAPLSPRLAEEEEEKEEDGVKTVTTEQEGRLRRRMVGPPIRYLIESEEQSHGLSAANHNKAGGEECTMTLQRLIKEPQEDKEEEEEDEVLLEETEQVGRPKRKTVGPPIRYLIESEEQSHGLPPANHSKARGESLKRRLRTEHQEDEEEEEEKKDVDQVESVKTEETEQMRSTVGAPVSDLFEEQSHGLSAANHNKAGGEECKMTLQRLIKEPQEDNEEEEDEVLLEETEQVERPKRKMVGPPIRYLIESEEQSHGLSTANHSKAGGAKQMLLSQRREYLEEEEEREEKDDDDGVSHVKIDISYIIEAEKQSHDLSLANHSKAGGVKQMLLSQRREHLEEEEKEEEGVKPVKTEQVGRPRRKAVGPPIRYLIESEEQSHGLSLANQSLTGGAKTMLLRQRRKDAEEEEDEVVLPIKTEEQVGRPRRKMVGPPVRYLIESEGQSHDLSPANESKAREAKVKAKMGREHQEEEEGLEHDNNQHQTAERRRRRRRRKLHRREHSDHTCNMTGGVQPKVSSPDPITCRKRKMDDDDKSQHDCHQDVIQSEERSSFQIVKSKIRGETSQCCKKRRVKVRQAEAQIQHTRAEHTSMVKKKVEEGGQERRCTEEQKKKEEEAKEDRVKPVQTEETEQAGRLRRKKVGPPIRYLLESEERSHGPSVANHSKARGDTVKKKQGRLRRKHREERSGGVELAERTDSRREESEEDGGGGGRWQLCELQRGGRRLSNKISCTKALHLHLHPAADDRGDEEDNANSDGENNKRAERSKKEEEAFLPASTKTPEWLRRKKMVPRNLQWWFAYQTMMSRRQDAERWWRWQETDRERGKKRRRWREEEVERGGEEQERRKDVEEKETQREVKKEIAEQPQRPRRKMVGPPIRYLCESEELSHGPVTANHNRAEVFQQGRKPQQKRNSGGGASVDTSMIDRPEGTEQTDRQAGRTVIERQTGRTNRDTGNGSKRKGGRPNIVMMDHETRGGVLEMTDRSDASERQTGHMATERQTGHMTTEIQVTLPVSTKAPFWLRCRKHVRRNHCSWFDCRTMMWRRWQERGAERRRKRKRCREDEEEKQVCMKEERGGEEGERSISDRNQEKETQVMMRKEVTEQPQRPRRKRVGPPIRYLLESEGLSHGPVTTNQDRVRVFKQCRKPEKKSKAGGGASDDTSLIDRPEDTDLSITVRKAGRVDTPKRKGGRPNMVVIDSDDGGGASEMTNRSDTAERKTGEMVTQRQTGQMETERQTGEMVTQTGQMETERQTGEMVTQRQTGHMIPQREKGHMITERQTGQTDTDRQTGQADTDRQTGLDRQMYLGYFDQRSSQLTILSPCCVRLQRLL